MEDIKDTTIDAPPTKGSEGGGARLNRAKEAIGEKYSKASEAIGEKYSQASEAMKNKYAAVRTRVDEVDFAGNAEKVRTYVRENPGKALLISVGVGFALGMMIRRSRRDDD